MTDRFRSLYNIVLNKEHYKYRQDTEINLCEDFSQRGLSPTQRMSERFKRLMAAEKPVILPGEKIVFMRTVKKLPDIFTQDEWQDIKSKHFLHEMGFVSNINPDYGAILSRGLDEIRQSCEKGILERPESIAFYTAAISAIDAVVDLSGRYAAEARRLGNAEAAKVLERVPRKAAQSFREALQMLRILHFSLWLEGEYHNTLGRFDQYMRPYFEKDVESGVLSEDKAFDLLEDFFLACNKDSDLYFGVQQGDNGQSMVLGGCGANGKDCFNALSRLCLKASKELKMIDPKINLRVGNNTGLDVFKMGTELTKEMLGFPQYSNDDVVIPGLVALGYSPQDAADYVVAACWEFIIPGKGMDIPNIGALSFPLAVDRALHKDFISHKDFESFFSCVKDNISAICAETANKVHGLWMVPAPLLSLMMHGCIESGSDISNGCVYNNFGLHGTGLSTAADSLAAIKKYVYDEKKLSAPEMLDAVDKDFEGCDELLNELRYHAPKFGNSDAGTQDIAKRLLEAFADALKGFENERGGCYRAGTGSAMFYLWHAEEIGASPDGRRKSEPFSANYSPSLFAKMDGPVSVINAFTKPDFTKTINGGPLTLEFHDSLFKDDAGIEKVAQLVQYYVQSGGHQLQLNAINRELLLKAQKNPDDYRNLIVRIWGWSAYFVELDEDFQNHVILRQEYSQ